MREEETETLHRNLGTVTGAFIGRRSRHFWHFSCALGGATSSAEKRGEGWSAAPAAQGLHFSLVAMGERQRAQMPASVV